jgi:hypothetical protein
LSKFIGLDPYTLFDIISASSGSSWVFRDRMARVLQNDFAPRAYAHIPDQGSHAGDSDGWCCSDQNLFEAAAPCHL